jgi:hypothetical protein
MIAFHFLKIDRTLFSNNGEKCNNSVGNLDSGVIKFVDVYIESRGPGRWWRKGFHPAFWHDGKERKKAKETSYSIDAKLLVMRLDSIQESNCYRVLWSSFILRRLERDMKHEYEGE